MGQQLRLQDCLKTVTVAVIVAAAAMPAWSQETQEEQLMEVIEALQERINELETRVQELETKPAPPAEADLEERMKAIEERVDEEKAAADNEFRVVWKDSLRFETKDGRYKFRIGGRVQNDWAWFDQDSDLEFVWDPLALTTRFVDTEDGTEFRRARISLTATLYDTIGFKSEYDFAGGDADFRDVYIELLNLPYAGTVRLGQFKEPFSLEELVSDNDTLFMERALPNVFAPSRNTGGMVYNTAFNDRMTWALGIFRDVDDYGNGADDGAYAITGRVTGVPYYADEGRQLIHLGAAYSYRNPDDVIRYRQRPEANLSPWRFVDTGPLFADTVELLGLEAAAIYGPLTLQGEYIRSDVDTWLLDDQNYDGFYLQAGYILTGENRGYNLEDGVLGSVKPNRPFSLLDEERGWGAWEIAARYSHLDLNSGSWIRGGEEENWTLGVSWFLNPNTRMSFNYIRAMIDHDLYDGDLDIFQTRFQFAW